MSESTQKQERKSSNISQTIDNSLKSIFQIFSLTHSFAPHTIPFICGVALLYFKERASGPLANDSILRRGPKTKRFSIEELGIMPGIRFPRGRALQSPQTYRVQQGPTGTESRRGSPPCLSPPHWCHGLWFQGRPLKRLPVCVSHSSFLSSAFSCSLSSHGDHAFMRTLSVSARWRVPLPCGKRDSSTPGFLLVATASESQCCSSSAMVCCGVVWFLLPLCPLWDHFKGIQGKSRD